MEKKIKITIVCPVFNAEKTIFDTIESVRNQSYKHWELILVDDGSTDCSFEICNSKSLEDKRIKVIHKINEGQAIARLVGAKESNGDYVLFLDSDDKLAKGSIMRLVFTLNQFNCDLVLFNALKIYDNKREYLYDFHCSEPFVSEDPIKDYFLKRIAGYSCSTCYKSDILKSIDLDIKKYGSLRYCEDLFLIFNVINTYHPFTVVLPIVLYEYYVQDVSITNNLNVSRCENRFFVYNYIYEKICLNNKILLKSMNANTRSVIAWSWMSFLRHAARESNYLSFKEVCYKIKHSFIYKKFNQCKKDNSTRVLIFLFRIRAYRLIFLFLNFKIKK